MITNLTPLINGQRYGWGEISINLSGFPIRDVTAIEYGEEQEKEADFGAGRFSKGTVRGRIKCTGKITLNTEIVQLIRRSATAYGGSILSLPPFPIIISFQEKPSFPVTTHTLLGCEFVKDAVKFAEGDKKYDQELDLIIRSIEWIH